MTRVAVCFVLCAATYVGAQAPLVSSAELSLKPGPFDALPRAALGSPVTFENDIDSVQCFPLHVSGRTIAWMQRAHRVADRLFIVPCNQLVTTAPASAGAIYGAGSRWWFEARPVDWTVEPWLELRRVDLPEWNLFSSDSVCGGRVA